MSTNYFSGIELPSAPGYSTQPDFKPRSDKSNKPLCWRDVQDFSPVGCEDFELGTVSTNQAAYKGLTQFERVQNGKRNFLFSEKRQTD